MKLVTLEDNLSGCSCGGNCQTCKHRHRRGGCCPQNANNLNPVINVITNSGNGSGNRDSSPDLDSFDIEAMRSWSSSTSNSGGSGGRGDFGVTRPAEPNRPTVVPPSATNDRSSHLVVAPPAAEPDMIVPRLEFY